MPARRPSAKAPVNAARAARRAASLPAPLAEGDDINRRGDIVRAAARLFREKGFEGTTVRDIAGAVGMQSGSPFYHFGSKVEMLVAVMEEGLRQGLETTRAVLARELPPRERLRALVEAHLRTIHGPGSDFIPVLLYDWRSLPEAEQRRIVAWRDQYDTAWQSAFEALRRDGLLAIEPKLARLFILGAINFTALWYRRGGELSLAEVADAAVDLFLPQVTAAAQ
jgi:TetR/AcrR family transcriptional regulator, cholesterol catabolism regulator